MTARMKLGRGRPRTGDPQTAQHLSWVGLRWVRGQGHPGVCCTMPLPCGPTDLRPAQPGVEQQGRAAAAGDKTWGLGRLFLQVDTLFGGPVASASGCRLGHVSAVWRGRRLSGCRGCWGAVGLAGMLVPLNISLAVSIERQLGCNGAGPGGGKVSRCPLQTELSPPPK